LAGQRLLRARHEKMTALADGSRRLSACAINFSNLSRVASVALAQRKPFYRYIKTSFRMLAALLPLEIDVGPAIPSCANQKHPDL
jgi:hypothetical protein